MIAKIQTTLHIAIFIVYGAVSFAQQSSTPLSLDNSPIEDQFQYVYQRSTDFEDFKLIKRWQYSRLKLHVLDSLAAQKELLLQARGQIQLKDTKIDSLANQVEATNNKLQTAINEKNSLTLLGIKMEKTGYNSIVWSVIFGLAFSLIVFILLYRRSYRVIIQTESDLKETRTEFEAFRKRALEREEGIVRKYHNELMKYKSKVSDV